MPTSRRPDPASGIVSRNILRALVTATCLLAAAAATTAASTGDSGVTTASPGQHAKPPPTLWRPCPVNGRDEVRDRLVRRFDRGPGVSTSGAVLPGGTSDLVCGDEKHSYYHIANGHGSEWTRKGVKSSENWREVADYAIAEALRNPMKVTYRAGGDSYCYSREIYLVHKVRGIPVDVFHPNVIVRTRDGVIITAYPANAPCR
jgi:hypothetical protein